MKNVLKLVQIENQRKWLRIYFENNPEIAIRLKQSHADYHMDYQKRNKDRINEYRRNRHSEKRRIERVMNLI